MSVIDHPTRTRILNLLRELDQQPGPTVPALFGGDDVPVDDDVREAFAHLTPPTTPDIEEYI